jgi:hypothetical protein
VQYRLKDGNDRLDMGFIAQDIEALLGEAYNVVGVGEDDDRTLSLRRGDLIAPLVRAVQEQQAQIEAQRAALGEKEARIARQDALIVELARRVEALEGRASGGRTGAEPVGGAGTVQDSASRSGFEAAAW